MRNRRQLQLFQEPIRRFPAEKPEITMYNPFLGTFRRGLRCNHSVNSLQKSADSFYGSTLIEKLNRDRTNSEQVGAVRNRIFWPYLCGF